MNIFRRPGFTNHLYAVLILFSCAAVQAYNYYYLVSKPYFPQRLELHNQIIAGAAPSPYIYRDLIPFIGDLLYQLGTMVFSSRLAFSAAYLLLDVAGISLIFISLYSYLSHYFSWKLSLTGSLFCAGVIGISAHEHFFQPWSFWEAGFFILSFILILRKNKLWLVVLVALATVNRETALFIPLVFLVTSQDIPGIFQQKARVNWKEFTWFCVYAGIWFFVYFGLRLMRGSAAHVESLQQILAANLDPQILWKTVLNIILFQGVFWVLAVLGYRTAPQFVRRTVWAVPVIILLMLVWAYWVEVRVLMPLYGITIPLGLSYLRSKSDLCSSEVSTV